MEEQRGAEVNLPVRKEVLDKGYVELIDYMGDDDAPVDAARVSFAKAAENYTKEQNDKLTKYLLDHKHGTPFEMITYKFRVHAPVVVWWQWVRHRHMCLSADTEITFNRPDKWKLGYHAAQSGNQGQKFTLERLYKNWNDPTIRPKMDNMLLRNYNEELKEFQVAYISDIMYSGKKHLYQITTENGRTLKCSKEHRLLTSNGWFTLEDAVGLELSSSGLPVMSKECFLATNPEMRVSNKLTVSYSKVTKIIYLGIQDCYDIEVRGNFHNFVANGIVVHNSYNFTSGRYIPFQEDQVYVPALWRKQSTSNKQGSAPGEYLDQMSARTVNNKFKELIENSYELYDYMINTAGVAKEQARLVLPGFAMYYTAIVQCNARSLMNFLSLRDEDHAQSEIRDYAKAIKDIVSQTHPRIFHG